MMSNYTVVKNTMNDYKYIVFTAPWSGRYKYSPQTDDRMVMYKAMVMSSEKVHLWVETRQYSWSSVRGSDWQLLNEIVVEPRIERNDFDALYEIVQRYL